VNERISTTPFLRWHFCPCDKIENCSAQFLAVCWIVHVQFKLHRLRDGFSVSNALLIEQSVEGGERNHAQLPHAQRSGYARAKAFAKVSVSRTRIGDSGDLSVSRIHALLSATAQAQKRTTKV